MRPTTFDPKILRRWLRSHKIATLPELKHALGTSAGLTVLRKLKLLDYRSSYSHSGRYYTLPSIARFDKTAIVLFYSLLDERQRRLYAGMELLRLGHGGDRLLAEFLDLDPHTVARGRQQLLDQEVAAGRLRRPGGGRKLTEKKRRK